MSSKHGTHDGSRVEAKEAGAHGDGHDAAHGAHASHDDDHGSHGGHGADPNAGVLRGEAPTPAWVMTATFVGFLTILFCLWLAIKIG